MDRAQAVRTALQRGTVPDETCPKGPRVERKVQKKGSIGAVDGRGVNKIDKHRTNRIENTEGKE